MKKTFILVLSMFLLLVQMGCALNPVALEGASPTMLLLTPFLDDSVASPNTEISSHPTITSSPMNTMPPDAILGIPCDDAGYLSFSLDFPYTVPDSAENFSVDNPFVYDVSPFKLSFRLPKGWYCLETPLSQELYLGAKDGSNTGIGTVYSILWLYDENDVCMGAFGYNCYNSQETSDNYNLIYSDINKNKDYRFTTSEYYFNVESAFNNVTAITQVYYSLGKLQGYGHWNSQDKLNVGILSYASELDIYVAFEFFTTALNALELIDVAKSICISPMEE